MWHVTARQYQVNLFSGDVAQVWENLGELAALAAGHLATIAELSEQAAGLAAMQPAALKERFSRQLGELLDENQGLPEERIAQEIAVLVTKADVREELDRLGAHLEAARDLLTAGGPVGRRLDFLCQELNREANTLASKSQSSESTIAYAQANAPFNSHDSRYVLQVMDRDGSNKRPLFPTEGQPGLLRPVAYDWSPDGQQIAALYLGNLHLIDLDSGQVRRLTGDGQCTQIDWAQ